MREREKPSETHLSYPRVFQKLGSSVQSNGASDMGGFDIARLPLDADFSGTSGLTSDHVDFRPGTYFKTDPDSHPGA